MKFWLKTSIVGALALTAIASGPALAAQDATKGSAVAYPFAFAKGTPTARSTAYDAAEGIARKAGYASVPHHVAQAAWKELGLPTPGIGHMPTRSQLRKLAERVKAKVVLFGSVSWHTRSIWVDSGPKTISDATVTVYVYSIRSGRIVFSKKSVKGRSDEKENGYKLAAAILITPVVSAVSGGPATPREQKAVQIALAKAYYRWVKR